MSKTLRQKISEILIKWNMPTRQAAISEIVALSSNKLQRQLDKIIDANYDPEFRTYNMDGIGEAVVELMDNE